MCRFGIAYSGSADDLVARARSMIEDAGGTFTGDVSRGRYTVKLPLGEVRGAYQVEPGRLDFEIDKKPKLVPCAAIESFLRGKLG